MTLKPAAIRNIGTAILLVCVATVLVGVKDVDVSAGQATEPQKTRASEGAFDDTTRTTIASTLTNRGRLFVTTFDDPERGFCYELAILHTDSKADRCIGNRRVFMTSVSPTYFATTAFNDSDGDPRRWDVLWIHGFVDGRSITRVDVLNSQCWRIEVPLRQEGMFVHVIERDQLYSGSWPMAIVGVDSDGHDVTPYDVSLDNPDGLLPTPRRSECIEAVLDGEHVHGQHTRDGDH